MWNVEVVYLECESGIFEMWKWNVEVGMWNVEVV